MTTDIYSAQPAGAMRTAVAIVFVAALIVAGCGNPLDRPVSATLTIHAGPSSSQGDLALAQRIISARLKQFFPEPQSTLTSSIEEKMIRFVFRGAPPDERIAMALAKAPGVLRISLANMVGDAWVTDADIEDVRLVRKDQGAVMIVRLSKTAGRRLFEMTSRNVGRVIRVSWNGETLMTATIQSPLGETFQFTAPMPPDGLMIRVVLEHGRLPVTIESAEFKHGA